MLPVSIRRYYNLIGPMRPCPRQPGAQGRAFSAVYRVGNNRDAPNRQLGKDRHVGASRAVIDHQDFGVRIQFCNLLR